MENEFITLKRDRIIKQKKCKLIKTENQNIWTQHVNYKLITSQTLEYKENWLPLVLQSKQTLLNFDPILMTLHSLFSRLNPRQEIVLK